jgi:hypothetical protein
VDPVTGDTHVFARTTDGAAAYFFRPAGGSFGPAAEIFPKSYRVRLVLLADGTLALARSRDGEGLGVRFVPRSRRTAGKPVEWSEAPEIRPSLPEGYETLYAIYPETSVFQTAAVSTLELALVGSAREHEVLHVGFLPSR